MLIDMSEKWFKPCYGSNIFGRLCAIGIAEAIESADQLDSNVTGDNTVVIGLPDVYAISDSGFDKEADSVLQLFGNDDTLLIRLHRDGHSFEGDSRSYIDLDDVRTVDLNNDGTSNFNTKLVKIVKDWIKEREANGQG